ncbi:MAG: hypothetical protein JNJ99_01925 [Crocinitomicaceae bacterium]|nr:hypothetical protein [Crocinitomicaceae bacterium]
MRKNGRKEFVVHLASLLSALFLVFFTILFISKGNNQVNDKPKVISGYQKKWRGYYPSLAEGEQAEIDFVASIRNKNQITLFGSSEFNNSPYASYNFLPDSARMPLLGIGKGFHQCFSIFCELLAVHEHLENSKICIILSPTWFHEYGTNTEAFLEFVKPNFINKIAADQSIDIKYKLAIGEYLDAHLHEFTGISNSMEYLLDDYRLSNGFRVGFLYSALRKKMKEIHSSTYVLQDIKYRIDSFTVPLPDTAQTYNVAYLSAIQNKFISSVTNNKIYVENDYYSEYLILEDGSQRPGKIREMIFDGNREWKDFLLLADLLAESKANCCFIMQPMNPHFYSNLELNDPLIDSVSAVLSSYEIPFFNMYSSDTSTYEPATLKDIMHLGDYGWMKINNFLIEQYGNP